MSTMRPRRIAMVAACPFPCERGTPIRIHRLSEALAARGHDVHVVTYHLGEPAVVRSIKIHRIADVPTYRRLEPGPTLQKLLVIDVLLARKLARLMREQPFDVIHAHHVEGLIAALLARRGTRCPIVFDAHTLLQSELPFYGFSPTRAIRRGLGLMLDRGLPPWADYIIAVTEQIRTRLLELGAADPDRIAVIGNGVERDLFEQAPRESANGRTERTLVFTGNLAAYQGVEQMLRGFAALRARRSDVRLMVVSGSSFDAFEALAEGLGVRDAIEVVHGGFEEVPGQLARSDVALNPRGDAPGVPQKSLNYMAAGLPIVSFRGSGRHLVDGDTALLAEDGDIEGFAAAIERILDDPALARRLGQAAQGHARSAMSWERSATLVEQVYGEAIALMAGRPDAPSEQMCAIEPRLRPASLDPTVPCGPRSRDLEP